MKFYFMLIAIILSLSTFAQDELKVNAETAIPELMELLEEYEFIGIGRNCVSKAFYDIGGKVLSVSVSTNLKQGNSLYFRKVEKRPFRVSYSQDNDIEIYTYRLAEQILTLKYRPN